MERGLTQRLTLDQLDHLSQRVGKLGGQRLSTRCEGYLAPFTVTNEHGDSRVAQVRTCACYRDRVRFEVPYADQDESAGASYIACANCDAISLQPRFQEEPA